MLHLLLIGRVIENQQHRLRDNTYAIEWIIQVDLDAYCATGTQPTRPRGLSSLPL